MAVDRSLLPHHAVGQTLFHALVAGHAREAVQVLALVLEQEEVAQELAEKVELVAPEEAELEVLAVEEQARVVVAGLAMDEDAVRGPGPVLEVVALVPAALVLVAVEHHDEVYVPTPCVPTRGAFLRRVFFDFLPRFPLELAQP